MRLPTLDNCGDHSPLHNFCDFSIMLSVFSFIPSLILSIFFRWNPWIIGISAIATIVFIIGSGYTFRAGADSIDELEVRVNLHRESENWELRI